MPRFRGADEIEIDALFAYLRAFPPRQNQMPGRHPALSQSSTQASERGLHGEPKRAFDQLGCVGCHGKGAAYEAKLQQALGKPAAEVARWIRNPELYRPGTPMPTFASVLDENAALERMTGSLRTKQTRQRDRAEEREPGNRERVANEQMQRVLRGALQEESHASPGARGPTQSGCAVHGRRRDSPTKRETEGRERDHADSESNQGAG